MTYRKCLLLAAPIKIREISMCVCMASSILGKGGSFYDVLYVLKHYGIVPEKYAWT